MFEKACNKYALMVIYRCKGKVLTKQLGGKENDTL